MLDGLITFAQSKGYTVDDDDDPPSGAAETVEARHDGIIRLLEAYDRDVVTRIREVAQTLDGPSTLRELVELRGRALQGG
jgi:hypothetical protein